MLKLRAVLVIAVLVLGGTAIGVLLSGSGDPAKRSACRATRAEGESSSASAADPLYAGPSAESDGGCGDRPGHPESFADLARANSSRASRATAPGTELRAGAYRAAVREARDVPATGSGTWQPVGDTPLQGNNTDYDTTLGSTQEGLPGLSGRTTAFARDAAGHIYAAVAYGGIWESDDNAASWHSVGDGLPTQVTSGIAWSSAGGGTLIALTGDDAFGGDSVPGLGAYYSSDGGKTWTHSSGIPDGVLGFKLAVDPTDPGKVYAGTGAGLFRSTDGGRSFVNVDLPTGKGAKPDCSGKAPTVKDCFLANMVTDVVVQGAKNSVTTGAQPGAVMAAVGWRAGTKKNADGSMQSPGNGIYVSKTGAPGTFTNVDMAGHATPVPPSGTDPLTQARIGRLKLGIADGPDQNHQIVYAIVQDAVKFNGGITGLDVPEPDTGAAQSDYLNGVWVSTDFGTSWKQLEGSTAIDNDSTTGSALAPPVCKAPAVVSYCPGIQAWYNLWIAPDPTRQTSSGVPTRVLFGLEEIWANNSSVTPPTGLDGSVSTKFDVIGRYYGNASCAILNALNNLPICPTQVQQGFATPTTTTHPDQHGALFVPDGKGGVTFLSGNDGGVFAQHTDGASDFQQDKWGNGNNSGLHTLMPYDAEMAKDGTLYMGLQDNGEAKVEPSGKSYTIYGGDGFYTAVDPDHSGTVYEEYVGGTISVSTDGGKTWKGIDPYMTDTQFATPFQMDPNDADHLMIGGRQVMEMTAGPEAASTLLPAQTQDLGSWTKVFDLGTQKHPGDASASASADDPANQLSAVDVLGSPPPVTQVTGPPTKDFSYTGPAQPTIPGAGNDLTGQDVPGAYEDHPFKIGANDGDASMKISLGWDDPTGQEDWDLYLYRKNADGTATKVGQGGGSDNPETLTVNTPAPGDYFIRAYNYTAPPTTNAFKVDVKFTAGTSQTAKAGQYPSAAYVGFCGYCDVITQGLPFGNGIATNVGGSKPGETLSSDGWHIAAAKGLPVRYITSVRMDPSNPSTVYATIAGYGRKWAAPGALGDDTSKVGKGHVFRSTDAGQTFTDISANLPDVPANWSVLRNGHLVVGTDLGVFESCDANGGAYFRLGNGLPVAPISTLRFKPGDPDLLVAATYGRGAYTYRFSGDDPVCPRSAATGSVAAASGGAGCAAAAAARAITAKPVIGRRRVRLGLPRSKRRTAVDVFQVSHGSRIFREHLMARFRHKSGSFTWNGNATLRGRKVSDGYYFARVKSPGQPLSRVVLERSHGRWSVKPDFYLRGTCGVLTFAKIERPVFGGARRFPLRYAYRTGSAATVTVNVFHGKKLVRAFKARSVKAKHTYRVTVGLRHLARGSYQVITRVRRGKQTVTVALVSRRI